MGNADFLTDEEIRKKFSVDLETVNAETSDIEYRRFADAASIYQEWKGNNDKNEENVPNKLPSPCHNDTVNKIIVYAKHYRRIIVPSYEITFADILKHLMSVTVG